MGSDAHKFNTNLVTNKKHMAQQILLLDELVNRNSQIQKQDSQTWRRVLRPPTSLVANPVACALRLQRNHLYSIIQVAVVLFS